MHSFLRSYVPVYHTRRLPASTEAPAYPPLHSLNKYLTEKAHNIKNSSDVNILQIRVSEEPTLQFSTCFHVTLSPVTRLQLYKYRNANTLCISVFYVCQTRLKFSSDIVVNYINDVMYLSLTYCNMKCR